MVAAARMLPRRKARRLGLATRPVTTSLFGAFILLSSI